MVFITKILSIKNTQIKSRYFSFSKRDEILKHFKSVLGNLCPYDIQTTLIDNLNSNINYSIIFSHLYQTPGGVSFT